MILSLVLANILSWILINLKLKTLNFRLCFFLNIIFLLIAVALGKNKEGMAMVLLSLFSIILYVFFVKVNPILFNVFTGKKYPRAKYYLNKFFYLLGILICIGVSIIQFNVLS